MFLSLLAHCAIRAFKSLLTPGVPKLFLLSALLSFVVLASLLGVSGWAINGVLAKHVPAGGMWLVSWLEGVGAILLAGFLFPLILPLVVSFFDDRIAQAIERHEYPHLPLSQPQPFWAEFKHDVRFTLQALFLNIVCLPLYFVPGVNMIWFYLLNGYLLGKQFFIMIGCRYVSRANVLALMQRHKPAIIAGGMMIMFSATIPVANLAAPIWGVALMVHLFHFVSPPAQTIIHG